jgi:two-component system, LytTR family, response regulator LytT
LDYLLKPIEKDRLAETVQRALRPAVEANRPLQEPAPAGSPRLQLQRTKILVKSGGRSFIVDAQDIVFATIKDGVITIATGTMEGESNYKTIEELQSNLDPETFWRVHRSHLVNINRIREVIPWFKSSYQLRMEDKRGTEIPVSRVQTKRLRSLLKL